MDKSPKSLAIAYDMARRARSISNKASRPAQSPTPAKETPRPESVAEAILAKRRALPAMAEGGEVEPDADDTAEDFDLDSLAAEAEEPSPKSRVDSIREKLKAARGF